jgi:hypothetical protein
MLWLTVVLDGSNFDKGLESSILIEASRLA